MEGSRALVLSIVSAAIAVALACGEESRPEPVRPEPPAPEAPRDETRAPPAEAEAPEAREPSEPSEAASPSEPPAPAAPRVASVEMDLEGYAPLALPEKMQNRIRSRLREELRARVLVRESIRLHHQDGRDVVFALYELNEIERCASERTARGLSQREAFRECRAELFEAVRADGIEAEECTEVRLVRAELAAPRAGTPPDWGGAITVAADVEVQGGCVLDRVRRFALADPDRDGRPELELDLWSHTPERTFRGMAPYTARSRHWSVLDAATLREQARHTLVTIGGDYEQMAISETASEVRFSDETGDGHPDVVERVREHEISGGTGECDNDPDTGWPGPRRHVDVDDENENLAITPECRLESDSQRVWPYDPTADAWTRPER